MTDEGRIRELEAEIDELEAEIDELEADRSRLEGDIREGAEKAIDRAREIRRLAAEAFGPERAETDTREAFAFWRALEDLIG